MRFAITGGTGFIGRTIIANLTEHGDSVHALTRSPQRAPQLGKSATWFAWDGVSAPPAQALVGVDAVLNLAGEPVNGRFTAEHKRRVLSSRVDTTRHLVEAFSKLAKPPAVLVSASAVGYYGNRGDEVLTEESTSGSGFLADVCKAWEAESLAAEKLGIRVARIRTGIVLGPGGGALAEMLVPFKLGVGGKLGDGQAWMPWIHLQDIANLFVHAATVGRKPVYNGSAPHPVTNAEFTRILAAVLHRPALFSVPRFALKLALGEMADVVMQSARQIPKAAEDEGFRYSFPDLKAALEEILR